MKPRRHILFLTVLVQCAVATSALSQSHWETAIYAEDTWHYLIRTIGLDVKLDFQTPMWLCIDIANGYTERFFNYIINLKTT